MILSSLQRNALKSLLTPHAEGTTFLKLVQCRMSSTRMREFIARLQQLGREFNDAEEDGAEEGAALVLALYPLEPSKA